jgi:hypothetical protein
MADRKPLSRTSRKRSFRAAYVFFFPLLGIIALGFMLTHVTPASFEPQVPSPVGGQHGPEYSEFAAILESPDTRSLLNGASTNDEKMTRTSAFLSPARTKPGWVLNQEHDNPETAPPWTSSSGEDKVNDVEASIADAVYHHIEHLGLGGDALSSLLYEFAQISPEDIPPTLSIQEFTAYVAATAAKDILTAKGTGSLPEDATVADIRFGTSPRPSESTEPPSTRFSIYDARIYAVFDTSAYEHSGVLLKWYRTDKPELFILQRYAIDPHAAYNYVWHKRKDGWPTGQYRVEVYSLGQSFRMMCSGEYEVCLLD